MRRSLSATILALALLVPTLAACGNSGPTSMTTPGAVAPTGADTGAQATPGGSSVTGATAEATTASMATTEATSGSMMATTEATSGSMMATTEATSGSMMATTEATSGSMMATTEATSGSMMATTEATAMTGATAMATSTSMMTGTAMATSTSMMTGTAMATSTGKKIKVGLVTDVGKVNDGTFNQFAYEGLKRAETELGIQTAYIETQAQTDYEKNMEQFASQGFDMIIGVGFLMGDALKSSATKHPNIKYAIVDFSYDPPLPNVSGLVFSEDQAGYLAGALAASLSKADNIAVVGGVEIPPVQRYVMGYENGAKSIKPDINVQKVYIDSFTDRARGGEAAKNFISQGADVIFGAGGQTGSGGIQAAAQAGVYVIGVDQDEYGTTFQKGAAPGANKIVSSAMKRVDNAVFLAIKSAQDGSFKGSTQVNDAASGGVGLAPFHDADAAIPADVKQKLQDILKGLADGSIKTNVTLK